jgi:hypothetical protein
MRHDKGTFFTVPKSVFTEPMPSKACKLLCYLYSISRVGGECRPGYDAMQSIIRDKDGDKGSRSTVKASLDYLDRKGWFLRRQRTGGKMYIYLRKEPLRFVKKEAIAKSNGWTSVVHLTKLRRSPVNGLPKEVQWMDRLPE